MQGDYALMEMRVGNELAYPLSHKGRGNLIDFPSLDGRE